MSTNRMSIVAEPRVLLAGFLSWAIPFAASFALFDGSGHPVLPTPLFKSVMVVIFGGVGCALLAWTFRRVTANAGNGLVIGLTWLVVNAALDLALLLPLGGMSVLDWLQDIGVRYLLIPVIAVTIGVVADRAAQPAR